jgi:hypothetical protein
MEFVEVSTSVLFRNWKKNTKARADLKADNLITNHEISLPLYSSATQSKQMWDSSEPELPGEIRFSLPFISDSSLFHLLDRTHQTYQHSTSGR